LEKLLPEEMPYEPEHWKDIMEDLQNQILPGLTHWQSPNFHAYYPGQTSYPAIVGDMIVSALSVVGFTWVCMKLYGISTTL
jgi:glutamate/tyrosine decarboxylase-like PLP-dependent enzyme